jgi:hypothetical protein
MTIANPAAATEAHLLWRAASDPSATGLGTSEVPFATAFIDNQGRAIDVPQLRASVNLIPELASGLLLGASLTTLGISTRRSRAQRAT